MLEIGTIIDGKYKILNVIGKGGMSVVYLAMNEKANKQWAIKEVRKDGTANYEVVKQGLVVETDILKRLNHKNLPSIIDVIDCEDSLLIVMDYIEGKPLINALMHEGAQPQERVIEWGKQICDVLGYLHSRKPPIIYRDMKPSNVMLKPDGTIMLIDFGTAREFKSSSVADTTCLGTQGYAAPEQFGGHGQTDARTDIYCLGATMYHLLTGHNPCLPPYEMRPIREINPLLSSGLEEIIIRCTQKNPENRYQSCAELMYALEHYSELDVEYKKVQSRKWVAFLTSAILTVVMGVASVGFKVAENTTTSNSYDGYLREASMATTDEEKIDNYFKAINLEPTKEEAYLAVLEEVFLEDENFQESESAKMLELINYRGDRVEDNKALFAEGNQEGYEEFSFQLGLAYYYYYENVGNKLQSKSWLQIAKDSSNLQDSQVRRAELLSTIADYYTDLGKSNRSGDSEVTYATYWNHLAESMKGNLVQEDNVKTALVVYREVVYQIHEYVVKFQTAGVSKQQLLDQLDMVEYALDEYIIDAAEEVETIEAKDEVRQSVENAREEVETAFSAGQNLEESGDEVDGTDGTTD